MFVYNLYPRKIDIMYSIFDYIIKNKFDKTIKAPKLHRSLTVHKINHAIDELVDTNKRIVILCVRTYNITYMYRTNFGFFVLEYNSLIDKIYNIYKIENYFEKKDVDMVNDHIII